MSVGPDFDPLAPESFESFHREFTELRGSCPVARSDAWNGFWAMTRYDDVLAAARDPENRVADPAGGRVVAGCQQQPHELDARRLVDRPGAVARVEDVR